MRKYGLFCAIALLLVVNTVVFVGIASNRSGIPEETVELSERELPLAYSSDENTGISLSFNYNHGNEWLDKKKLAALGFDCSIPEASTKAALFYRHMLPRKTYAVFEYAGEAWKRWIQVKENSIAKRKEKVKQGKAEKKDLEELQIELKKDLMTSSRLFAIDANNDPTALRKRYPEQSRFIIVPVVVRLDYNDGPSPSDENKEQNQKIRGYLSEVLVDSIHVPMGKRSLLEPLHYRERLEYYNRPAVEPRYMVKLQFGKRYEPWIVDVRQINGKNN